jgi:hypothetical protein
MACCCGGGGIVTGCCPSDPHPETYYLLWEHVSGPVTHLDGYTDTTVYGFIAGGWGQVQYNPPHCLNDGTSAIQAPSVYVQCDASWVNFGFAHINAGGLWPHTGPCNSGGWCIGTETFRMTSGGGDVRIPKSTFCGYGMSGFTLDIERLLTTGFGTCTSPPYSSYVGASRYLLHFSP